MRYRMCSSILCFNPPNASSTPLPTPSLTPRNVSHGRFQNNRKRVQLLTAKNSDRRPLCLSSETSGSLISPVPIGEHLQHLEPLLAVATAGREEHRTTPHNEGCSGPKCQQCDNWETLIHVKKANLISEPDILIFYFKAWPTHLNLGVQNYVRPLAFFKATRHSFVL